jgi:tetratricopeptide (TPR) repeat protein
MATSAGSALSLIKAVLEIVADRGTGLLDVRSDGLPTRIYFADGKPVFAEDEALGESFGRLLTRKGVISNADFVRVIDEMKRAAAGNNQLRFGEVAVGLGVLTPERVEQGLAEQVCVIITRTLQRGESEWTFEPSLPAARPPRLFSLEINRSVLAALREPGERSQVVAKVAEIVAARPEELVMVAGPAPASEVPDQGSGATAETQAARMGAEQAFQKGLALLREGKTASAAGELGRAAELQPESLEYLLYATWAKARRYREIPSESDRETLLEIAQRSKRRDPLFAFGSYVIGQVAMWAGDDATAKKWFYEALRLDPASEAGAQVRILARRGSTASPGEREMVVAPPSAAGEERASAAPAASPAAAPEGSAPPAGGEPPSRRAPSGSRGGRLAAGAALLGAAVLVVVLVMRMSSPPVELPPAPAIPAALPIDAPAPAAAPPPPAPEAPASKETKAAPENGDDDPQMGTVVLPSRASGHRIFVDGRRAKTEETSEGIEPLHLRCGSHVIQIGSGGTPETIELPCRGEVQIQ